MQHTFDKRLHIRIVQAKTIIIFNLSNKLQLMKKNRKEATGAGNETRDRF